MEILYIDCIWLHLCLQAESITFMINMTVLSLLILNKIACIELHTRAIGGNLHTDTGFPAVCSRNRTDIALCIIICYIVMVITACKLQLPIGLETLKSIGVPATGAYSPVGMDWLSFTGVKYFA